MTFKWFKILNIDEFESLGVVSKTYSVILEGIGQKDVLVVAGNDLCIVYEGIFLPTYLNGRNPVLFESHAVFVDDESQDVYLGIGSNES